jgi:hypothetical protein
VGEPGHVNRQAALTFGGVAVVAAGLTLRATRSLWRDKESSSD